MDAIFFLLVFVYKKENLPTWWEASCFDKPNRILALAQSHTLRTCKRRDGKMKQARSENMQKIRREVKPQRKTH
jgi:hypothetical protein